MTKGINTAASGLTANQRRLQISAHNTANLNTKNFKKSRASLKEGKHGGVEATVRKEEVPGTPTQETDPSDGASANVEIAEETVEQISARRGFKANAQVIRTQDEMLGKLLDLRG